MLCTATAGCEGNLEARDTDYAYRVKLANSAARPDG
jgi:hypothetical protein